MFRNPPLVTRLVSSVMFKQTDLEMATLVQTVQSAPGPGSSACGSETVVSVRDGRGFSGSDVLVLRGRDAKLRRDLISR